MLVNFVTSRFWFWKSMVGSVCRNTRVAAGGGGGGTPGGGGTGGTKVASLANSRDQVAPALVLTKVLNEGAVVDDQDEVVRVPRVLGDLRLEPARDGSSVGHLGGRQAGRCQPLLDLFHPQPRPGQGCVRHVSRPATLANPPLEEIGEGFLRHGARPVPDPSCERDSRASRKTVPDGQLRDGGFR